MTRDERTPEAGPGLDATMDVGEAILARRSIRRFDRGRPVPPELVDAVLDAARWAPSSCNLQTWDFIVVEDEALRQQLSAECKSVLVAPVNVFVVFDRELAREGQANVQSASAAVMTMLLAATGKGLASLWVNAVGNRDRVRAMLGVPDEFEVLALVCFGWPADDRPPPAPDRRPLSEVVHRDRYSGQGALPRSPDPDDWSLGDIGLYFHRKLQSGTRYNKPRRSFTDPVLAALDEHVGPPRDGLRLLDVLSGTGLFTEELARRHPDADMAVMELNAESHFFADRRCGSRLGFVAFPASREAEILAACAPPGTAVTLARESGGLPVMPRVLPRPRLAEGGFDVATITFRLEGLPAAERSRLLSEVVDRLAPGGRVVLTYTSRRSWHTPAYALRRKLGRNSVETAPVPEPHILGPYEPLSPRQVQRLAREAGLAVESESRLMPLPELEVLLPRLAEGGALLRFTGTLLKGLDVVLRPFEPLLRPLARVRCVSLVREADAGPAA